MSWMGRAQVWLRDNADRLFSDWLKTSAGKSWMACPECVKFRGQYHRCGSPYTYGFSLPGYQHELIAAVGRGDEETAKAIMLFHGIGACTVGD